MASVTLDKVNKLYENGFHAVQNLGPYDGVDLHLLELVGSQTARFRNDVLRDRELSDVVQKRGRLDRLQLERRDAHLFGKLGRIKLHSP